MAKFSNDLIVEIEDVRDHAEIVAGLIGKAAECEDRNEGIERLRFAWKEAKFMLGSIEELMDMAKEERDEDEE